MKCKINEHKCKEVADILGVFSTPKEKEEHHVLKYLNKDLASNYYLIVVAICHQTQNLEGIINGLHIRGWDYLTQKYLFSSAGDNKILNPEFWINLKPNDLERIYFCEEYGSTLSDIEGRIQLINDIGIKIVDMDFKYFSDMYVKSNGFISGYGSALENQLAMFSAFKDPVKKKSYLLLGLTQSILGWNYKDEKSIGAPVDYHEIRGHLRIGTIEIVDIGIKDRLINNSINSEDDIEIRSAVLEAINIISSHLSCTPMVLHYLFWNYFRNVCKREEPECNAIYNDNNLPERYKKSLNLVSGSKCIFCNICNSKDAQNKIVEYAIDTEYY